MSPLRRRGPVEEIRRRAEDALPVARDAGLGGALAQRVQVGGGHAPHVDRIASGGAVPWCRRSDAQVCRA